MARAASATMLRGGAFKPRTSPYAFQGLGVEGLEILSAVREATGLPIVTEVVDARDVAVVAEHGGGVGRDGVAACRQPVEVEEGGAVGVLVQDVRPVEAGLARRLDEEVGPARVVGVAGDQLAVDPERLHDLGLVLGRVE